MNALLDSLLKRALPKPRDWSAVEYRGFMLPAWQVEQYRQYEAIAAEDNPPTNGETA